MTSTTVQISSAARHDDGSHEGVITAHGTVHVDGDGPYAFVALVHPGAYGARYVTFTNRHTFPLDVLDAVQAAAEAAAPATFG